MTSKIALPTLLVVAISSLPCNRVFFINVPFVKLIQLYHSDFNNPIVKLKTNRICPVTGYHIEPGRRKLWFRIAWLSAYGDGLVKGVQQTFAIPDRAIESLLLNGGNIKLLYTPGGVPAKIEVTPVAAKMIGGIAKDKRLRRAFSKAMRDCFNWQGDHIALSKDGRYSFYFTTESGFPKCGGLILHESQRNGHPCIYYSVHT